MRTDRGLRAQLAARRFAALCLVAALFGTAHAASMYPNIASPDPVPHIANALGFTVETLQEDFKDAGADMLLNDSYVNDGNFHWYNGTQQCCQEFTDTDDGSVTYPVPYDSKTGKTAYPQKYGGGGIKIQDLLPTASSGRKVWSNALPASVAGSGSGWAQATGYFEVAAVVAGTKGAWTAPLWLETPGCRTHGVCGEIDVAEQYAEYPGDYSATVHDYTPNGVTANMEQDFTTTADLFSGTHNYGVMITTNAIQFYFDRKAIGKSVPMPAHLVGEPWYLLFDQGIGGACATNSAGVMTCQATAGAPVPVTILHWIHVWGTKP